MSDIDFNQFVAAEYVKTCNWFDLKAHYYNEKAKNPNADIIPKIKTALKEMDTFRKSSIKEAMIHSFNGGKECTLIEKSQVNDTFDEHSLAHLEKVNVKPDTFAWYFDCEDFYYIMTSFGSQTLTSDFDFSVYRIKKEMETLTSEMELESIKDITSEMFNVGEYVKLRKCNTESMQKCFDSNGYPEIMVYYKEYFRDLKLETDKDMRDSRYANVMSSKIIRYCVVSQIYVIRAIDALNQRTEFPDLFYSAFRYCYFTLWDSTKEMVIMNNFKYDLEKNELISDPVLEEDLTPRSRQKIKKKLKQTGRHRRHIVSLSLITDVAESVMSYRNPTKNMRQQFLVNIFRLLNYFRRDRKSPDVLFKECVSMVDDPTKFMEKIYQPNLEKNFLMPFKPGKNIERRRLQHLGKVYEVFDEVFYIPENWSRRKIIRAPLFEIIENQVPELEMDTGSGGSLGIVDQDDSSHDQRPTTIINPDDLQRATVDPVSNTNVDPIVEEVQVQEVEADEMINRLLLPFLGACHIWADEAYVTFGALEFVKNEKEIIKQNPTVKLRCDTYIETYFENMGMMLLHIIEEAQHKDSRGKTLMKKPVAKFQMISDAYSKYLRRSLLAIELPCLNDFGVEIDSFFVKGHSFQKNVLTHQVFLFYQKIRDVDQSADDKKDQYYQKFKSHRGEFMQVKQLIHATLRFHFIMTKNIFNYYDKRRLLVKPQTERERVLIVE